MGAPNPVDHFEAYETFILAGVPSPGFAKFKAPERSTGWDVQTPQGSGGSMLVRRTQGVIEIECEIYLWKGEDRDGVAVDHFLAWDSDGAYPAFKKVLDSKPKQKQSTTEDTPVGKNPDGSTIFLKTTTTRSVITGLKIVHPMLNGLLPAITEVVVKSWTPPEPDGKGGATSRIVFIEHRPLRNITCAPALGSEGNKGKDDPLKGLHDAVEQKRLRNDSPPHSLIGNPTL